MVDNDYFEVWLSVAVAKLHGLSDMVAGYPIDKKRRIKKIWAAQIRPPASPPSLIGLVEDSESIKVAVCLDLCEGIVTAGPVEVQSDLVSQELCKLDLWSGGGEIPFGGFSYRLLVSTTHLTARLDLSRTTHVSRLALARSIFDSMHATIGEDSRCTGFLREWQHELESLQSSGT